MRTRPFKIGFAILGSLIGLLILTAAVLVMRPEWILTPPRINRLITYFGASYHPQWKSLEVVIRTEAWNKKSLQIEAADLCFDGAEAKGCIQQLSFHSYWSWPYPIEALAFDRLILLSKDLLLKSPPSPPMTTISLPSTRAIARIAKMLAPGKWGELRIEAKDIEKDGQHFDLEVHHRQGDVPAIDLLFLKNDKNLEVKGEWTQDSLGYSSAHLDYALGTEQKASLSLRPDPTQKDHFEIQIDAALTKNALKITAPLILETQPSEFKFTGPITVSWQGGSALKADLHSLNLFSTVGSNELSEVDLNAQFSVPTASKQWAALSVIDLAAQYKLYNSRAAIKISSPNPEVKINIVGDCLVPLPLSRPKVCDLPPKIEVGFPFALAVDALKGSPSAIFAPFQVLQGPIDFKIEAEKDLNRIQLGMNSDLSGSEQKLKLALTGAIEKVATPAPSASLDLTLQDIQIQLPNIDTQGIPAFKSDPRIKKSIKADSKKTPVVAPAAGKPAAPKLSFPFQLNIKTEQPLRLRSNLTATPIPIGIDYHLSESKNFGTISIQPIDIQIFRRKARLQKLNLKSQAGQADPDIDGLIDYATSEAKIQILITGNTAKPDIHFTSEPPLQQTEILSLLLFGRSSTGADEAATVGNAQAAFASGAFGLASLYLFASTPVESVGYNPVTHSYSIRVHLPGGISAEYGNTFDQNDPQQYVTLRRRLGAHWMLSTEWQDIATEPSQTVSTFLQWFTSF